MYSFSVGVLTKLTDQGALINVLLNVLAYRTAICRVIEADQFEHSNRGFSLDDGVVVSFLKGSGLIRYSSRLPSCPSLCWVISRRKSTCIFSSQVALSCSSTCCLS